MICGRSGIGVVHLSMVFLTSQRHTGPAPRWYCTFLLPPGSVRQCCGEERFSSQSVLYGVPQGSVHSTQGCTVHNEVLQHFGMMYHQYADRVLSPRLPE